MKHIFSTLLIAWTLWASTQVGGGPPSQRSIRVNSQEQCDDVAKSLYETARNDGLGRGFELTVDYPGSALVFRRADGATLTSQWRCAE